MKQYLLNILILGLLVILGQNVLAQCTPVNPIFLYPDTLCKGGSNPFNQITVVTPGGQFSINKGASINPNTGIIDLNTTFANNFYRVRYTVGNCPDTSSQLVFIDLPEEADMFFPDSICVNSFSAPLPIISGLQGGIFEPETFMTNFTVDPATGEIDLSSLFPGFFYTLEYRTSNRACRATIYKDFRAVAGGEVSFSYPDTVCQADANPMPDSIVGTGGTFTIDPPAAINAATGEVFLSNTTNGTLYTISYTLPDDCQSTFRRQMLVDDFEAPTAVCQNITVMLDTTGTAVVTAAQLDSMSMDNCEIASITISQDTFTKSDLGPNMVSLIVTDVSGNADTCSAEVFVEPTTSIRDLEAANLSLVIYPNPVEDILSIQWDSPWNGDVSVEIYNTTGQIVQSRQENKFGNQMELTIGLGDLPTGMYIVKTTQNGYAKHTRVFKK